jgi:hypothetical protein
MAKSSNPGSGAKPQAGSGRDGSPLRDPKFIIRVILGILLAANLVAGGIYLFPPGGSPEDMEHQLASLRSQISQGKTLLAQTREYASKVEKGRAEGDKFLTEYFLDRRTAPAAVEDTLVQAADAAKIKPREITFSIEAIEGSDTLSMWTVNFTFDGAYRDVLNFVHEIDRSPRFLIIESLNTSPQQGGKDLLTVAMKIDAFVREEPGQ